MLRDGLSLHMSEGVSWVVNCLFCFIVISCVVIFVDVLFAMLLSIRSYLSSGPNRLSF